MRENSNVGTMGTPPTTTPWVIVANLEPGRFMSLHPKPIYRLN
jgi:hypothetical protein